MPIGFVTENHETLLDVEHIIHGLRRQHPDVTYVQMPCVNDHPMFLEMAVKWANPHIADLLSDHALSVNPRLAIAQAKAAENHHHVHVHHYDHSHHHH